MKTIVTHPGAAHRDEFMACCILIARIPVSAIFRRDATQEDLDCESTIVLDQGGQLDYGRWNLDHHQFPSDAPPACSITLAMSAAGVDFHVARDAWLWLAFSEWLDSKGPFRTAKHFGIEPDVLQQTVSPVETSVLRWFGSHIVITPGDPLWDLMAMIGGEKLDYLDRIGQRLKRLDECVVIHERNGLEIVNASAIDRKDDPVLGLEMYVRREHPDAVVTITQDDRGGGLSLFRRNDDPRINFAKLQGKPGVTFAHNGGFVAKIEAGVDPLPLIGEAITETKADHC